jgi:hypothetical protein
MLQGSTGLLRASNASAARSGGREGALHAADDRTTFPPHSLPTQPPHNSDTHTHPHPHPHTHAHARARTHTHTHARAQTCVRACVCLRTNVRVKLTITVLSSSGSRRSSSLIQQRVGHPSIFMLCGHLTSKRTHYALQPTHLLGGPSCRSRSRGDCATIPDCVCSVRNRSCRHPRVRPHLWTLRNRWIEHAQRSSTSARVEKRSIRQQRRVVARREKCYRGSVRRRNDGDGSAEEGASSHAAPVVLAG